MNLDKQQEAKETAKELLKNFFRTYDSKKYYAISSLYYQVEQNQEELSHVKDLPQYILQLADKYVRRKKWTFTAKRKLNLQDTLLAHIK
jgi:hypothetical protein